jgi:hypothetical protein
MQSNAEKDVTKAVEIVDRHHRRKPAAYTHRTSTRSTSQPAPISEIE